MVALATGYSAQSFAEISLQGSTVCAAKQYAMSLKYQQQSAEIQALQWQAYHLATDRLQQILAQSPQHKNLAIVTDLDETVLDNSDFLVQDLQNCRDYTEWKSWSDWEKYGRPKLIPGSLDFLNFAAQQNVKIFYISDRSQQYRAQTLAHLQRLGLPQAEDAHLLLYGTSKEQRRQQVAKNYQIVMLLGDTLHDFSDQFNNQQDKLTRQQRVEQNHRHFGYDWIMLPNVSYGAWSKDVYTPLSSEDFPVHIGTETAIP
ncbi:5'-nucleotidase, lipoprotein e(P4) family [Acinetobacter qingfengensis]|nr:5'-nucleotidase, lipoprotein e(P4) family [Acinetobacter qingfengensis]